LNCSADITCAKKTEEALLDYIRSVDADADVPDVRDSNVELSSRKKRRRLDNSYECTGGDDDRDNEHAVERSVTENGNAEGSAERTVADDEEAKAVKILTKKILIGMVKRVKQIKVRERQTIQLNNANPKLQQEVFFELATTQSTQPKELKEVIDRIWCEVTQLMQDSEEAGWKCLFICSCLRILYGIKDDNRTVTRWLDIARIVNSIVDGLWKHWGPHALFVYEALASKLDNPLQRQLLTYK